MNRYDTGAAEEAILAVLAGTPLAQAAPRVPTSVERLAEAIELYRDAGRAALDDRLDPSGWFQVYIDFADYPTAEQTVLAYLVPALGEATEAGMVGGWWFVRKHPCWRFRISPGPAGAIEDVKKHIADALDSMVSWGVARRWWPSLYEPESFAFGGSAGTAIAHKLFHADSVGVLDYLRRTTTRTDPGLLDPKATSLLLISLFLRAAGQEWSEQGDIWAKVEAKRALPDDVPAERVSTMTGTLRKLLTADSGPLLTADGPLAPLADWAAAVEHAGQALADADREGCLSLGTRSILARHILFHWNRMGFSTSQQAIWTRAARETILGE
ncbi:thiopeptide-type bacteriocin biosynthesis protein [Streptomyces sp. NPDC006923]|uniref:thiopeptide-type bacteriocin biosynthesis protein n=1 Tax=Streptomyces sp. NPDC006923 TaxID=3155355 RepID=UPI0033D36924